MGIRTFYRFVGLVTAGVSRARHVSDKQLQSVGYFEPMEHVNGTCPASRTAARAARELLGHVGLHQP